MLTSFPQICRAAASAVLLLAAALGPRLAQAQTPTGPVYTGPRYPGGPDSLRADVQRYIKQANLAVNGEVFLPLVGKPSDRGNRHQLLMSPSGTPASALVYNKQVVALARELRRKLPALVPATELLPDGRPINALIIPLVFGSSTGSTALAYGDENPTFPAALNPAGNGEPVVPSDLLQFIQSQIHYPQQALRQRSQGVVYAYFEVSETGAIENTHIIGSGGPVLDAEVLRVMQLVPSALTPPRYQGRPARVYFVQPFTFKIK